jgi:hypothetical protein
MKNKQKEWHPATKPLTFDLETAPMQLKNFIMHHAIENSYLADITVQCS